VEVDHAILKVDKPCARCSVVNVDGRIGMIDNTTLRTLSSYRRDSGNIYFGQFLAVQSLSESGEDEFAALCIGSDITPQNKNLSKDSVE